MIEMYKRQTSRMSAQGYPENPWLNVDLEKSSKFNLEGKHSDRVINFEDLEGHEQK